MPTNKPNPSELFEGPESSLRKTFDEAVRPEWEQDLRKNWHVWNMGEKIHFIHGLLLSQQQDIEQEREEQFNARIGMLRQWLNQDRIDHINKMVTNEELKLWFT